MHLLHIAKLELGATSLSQLLPKCRLCLDQIPRAAFADLRKDRSFRALLAS